MLIHNRLKFCVTILIALTLSCCLLRGAEDPARRIWLGGYEAMTRADRARNNNAPLDALHDYEKALSIFQEVSRKYPHWNTSLIKYRLDYCLEQIAEIRKANQEDEAFFSIEELRLRYSRQLEAIQKLKDGEAALQKEVTTLREALERARSEAAANAANAENIKLLRQDRDNLTAQVRRLTAQLLTVQEDLKKAQTTSVEIRKSEELSAQIRDLQRRLGEVSRTLDKTAAARDDLLAQSQRENQWRQQAEQKIASLNSQLQLAQQQRAALEADLLKLQQDKWGEQGSDITRPVPMLNLEAINDIDQLKALLANRSENLRSAQMALLNLQRKLTLAEESVTKYSSELADMRKRAAQSTTAISQHLQSADAMKAENISLRKSLNELRAETDIQKQLLVKLENQYHEATQLAAPLKEQISALTRQNRQLEERLVEASKQNQRHDQESQQLTQNKNSLEKQLQQLTTEKNDLVAKIAQLSQHNGDLTAKIRTLTQERSTQQTQLDEQSRRQSQDSAQLNSLRQEQKRLLEQRQQLNDQIAGLNNRVNLLETELRRQNQSAQAAAGITALAAEKTRELEKTRKELATTATERDAATAKLTELQRRFDDQAQKLQAMLKQNQDEVAKVWRSRLADAEAELRKSQQQQRSLEAAVIKRENEKQTLAAEVDRLKRQVAEGETDRQKIQEEESRRVAQLNAQIALLQRQAKDAAAEARKNAEAEKQRLLDEEAKRQAVLNEKISQLQQEVQKHSHSSKKVIELNTQIAILQRQAQAANQEARQKAQDQEQQQAQEKQRVAQLNDRIAQLQAQLQTLNIAAQDAAATTANQPPQVTQQLATNQSASLKTSALLPEEQIILQGYLRQGVDAERAGKVETAQWNYQQALGIQPDNLIALKRLGLIAANHSQDAQAAKYLGQAFRLNPDDPEVLLALGFAMIQLNRPQWALANLARAAALQPQDSNVARLYGVALSTMRWREAAQKQFLQALKLNPKDHEAAFNLAMLELAHSSELARQAQQTPLQRAGLQALSDHSRRQAYKWYQTAVANGAQADPNLEKLLQAK